MAEPKDKSIYLKATIRYIDREYIGTSTPTFGDVKRVLVDYQLDKYFVPENTGLELEKAARRGGLAARVKILKGYPLLRDVFESPKNKS